ncbi:A24 family peptidase [Streptomyces sp. XM4193]|uniref:prepilin peptidase n=1 Tax=Streptomyces sp. XM4193 TaxID=2929782 RepID=UPI001FFBFCCD|nr:A24 family peptidase [Streptomyces sp. XM4193]MCK1795959.1 A24 family peptidase [Streptomyces sp. XM4193]
MLVLLSVIAAGYGVAAGLLLPRPVHRLAVPADQPWRTTCPDGHPLPAGLLGAGSCARCGPGRPHGPSPAPIAAFSATVCVLLTVTVGPRPELTVWLLLVPVLLLLALVDVRVHRLPDLLTLPAAAGTAALLGLASLLPDAAGSWRSALLGGLALGGAYLLLFLIHPRGMGFGDVKLALTLGFTLGWYGWAVLFLGAFAGFLLGALYGAALIVAGRAHRRTPLPFGPFMLLGALAGVALGGLAG